jgi:hypothetical protein
MSLGLVCPNSNRSEELIPRNKNQNTFAKRQREQEKRRKAEDKLKRRAERKDSPPEPPGFSQIPGDSEPPRPQL